MGRWLLILALSLAGLAWLAYGILVELQVRAEVGTGLARGLANIFYDDTIARYRWFSRSGAIGGPLLLLAAWLLAHRRRSPGRLAAVAAAHEASAAALMKSFQAQRLNDLPPRARKRCQAHLGSSRALRQRAASQQRQRSSKSPRGD